MPLSIAIQMDAIDTINIDGDTTFVLGLEAQRRGHTLYYYQPHQLSLKNGKVVAKAQPLSLNRAPDNYYTLGDEESIELRDVDVVLMRQDPPFDMNYLTYTYLLEKIHPQTLVVNNPTEVRNCPEKIFVTEFSEFMPPTLLSIDKKEIIEFYKQHQAIILKPLYAHGGADINLIRSLEELEPCYQELSHKYNHPLVCQAFLANVTKGDKRIILIDGEPVGALNRIPAEGDIRSNLVVGGSAEKAIITPREQEICEALGPELKKRGLILVGIDVIDGFITEINVTSPTGVQAINRLNNTCLESHFWDVVENKV